MTVDAVCNAESISDLGLLLGILDRPFIEHRTVPIRVISYFLVTRSILGNYFLALSADS